MSEDLTVEQVLHSVEVKDIVNTQHLVAIQICSYMQHLTWYEMSLCQINGLSEILTVEQVLYGNVEHLYWLSCQDLQLYELSYTLSTELIAK